MFINIKKVNKIQFIKNAVTLSSGSMFAQVVIILTSPLLTKIYTPEEFGILATFLVFGYICVTIATGKYELSIFLPKEDIEARKLVKLSITLALYLCSILFVISVFCYPYAGKIFNLGKYNWTLMLLPFFVLFNAIFDTLKYYAIRNKFFSSVAHSVFIKALFVVLLQVLFGLLGWGGLGLIISMVLALLVGNQQLINVFFKNRIINYRMIFNFSLKNYKNEKKRYINFPKYSMFSNLLNTISVQLPILFLTAFFSSSISGFFLLTYRVLNLPMALLGNAIGDAFVQRASEIKDDRDQLRQITWSLYRTLLLIGIVPVSVLFYFGEDLFAFVFGESWKMSGSFASVLSFWTLSVFICSPISNILFVKEKQQQGLIFQVAVFISRLVLFLLAVSMQFTAMDTVIYFGILGALLFFGLIVFLLVKIGVKLHKVLLYTLIIIILGQFPIYLLSLWI